MKSLIIYSRPDCDDSDHARQYLNDRNVSFSEVNIDVDKDAETFVIFINQGNRVTPTLVLNDGRMKTIAAEPTDFELDTLIQQLES